MSQWAASPKGDKHELEAAWARLRERHPDFVANAEKLLYIGTDGVSHHFVDGLVRATAKRAAVPVSPGWKPDPRFGTVSTDPNVN